MPAKALNANQQHAIVHISHVGGVLAFSKHCDTKSLQAVGP